MTRRYLACFFLVELVLSLAIYRDALWGESLLAPLDCGPTLMPKFRFAAPAAKVPANHYTVDLFTYDLPIQHTVYHAYHRGEIPWWDPYTYGGRPLLADTPVNGSDPLRLLCYAVLPFELAYNWCRVAQSLLTGVGMLLLLRRWQVGGTIAVLLALAYQFSSFYALQILMPTVQGSLAFYPFLWLAWDAWWRKPNAWSCPAAALAVAGVFYAGNPQSHTYVVLFALAFLLGYARRSFEAWRKLLPVVAVTGILGAMLAAPVLAPQIELLARNVRPVGSDLKPLSLLSGVASLSAVFPWALGTFRSLDLSKLFGQTALGFCLHLGSVAAVLAMLGARRDPGPSERRPVRRTALWLVAIYFLVLSTPLLAFLYARLAGLAVMGLAVLAAFGVEHLWNQAKPLPRLGWTLAGLIVAGVLVLHVTAFLVYPKALPAVRRSVERQLPSNRSLDHSPALREFQLGNLPNEITFKNPEVVLASLSLAFLAVVCLSPAVRQHRLALPCLLILNLLPALLFYHRFIPNQPVALWHRLQAGGPEQQRVAKLMADKPVRLYEIAPGMHDMALPHQWAHVYRVRMVNGYSSLQPRSMLLLSAEDKDRYRHQLADYTYETTKRGQARGNLSTNAAPGTVLFQWVQPVLRSIEVQLISLCELRLTIAPGPAATLLWTDTYYPGWRALADAQPLALKLAPPCFTSIEIPSGAQTIVLRYEPTYFRLGLALAVVGLVGLLGVTLLARRKATTEPSSSPGS
ncbi:MAG: hypothetical protein HZA90_20510 [Verrucomicrobia bacterium]|nr:hypothetical protein [Verrucomicrobiota bacterium]